MHRPLSIACLLLTLASIATDTRAQDWTRFRGPNGSGVSPAKGIPARPTGADVNWKVELPGSGHSSPVLWGHRLFLTTTGDKSGGLSVLCLNADTGKKLWQHDFPLTPFARHAFNSFASSTPALDGERVYVVWNEPEHYFLAALDHEGHPIWQRDFGPFVSQHGCGISPVVYANKVYLGNEQDDAALVKDSTRSGTSFVVAVDAKTGKTVWQTPRRSAVVAYSTPCLYQPRNQPAALVFASQGQGIYALDPETGKVVWDFPKAFDKRSVSSPILAGDLILGSCGSGGGGNFVTAIKPGRTQPAQPAELAYQLKRSAPYVPTGVAVGNLVWLWSDSGIVTCLEASTGAVRYQERVGGDYFGSPVWVEGRLYCVSTTGELVVLEAGEKFNVLHRYPLEELCHSTPAVSLGHLFIHTEKHLWSLGKADSSSAR